MSHKKQINLRIPGPTPLPPAVLKSLSRQMISHRGSSYEEIHQRTVENLRYFFQTKNDLFLITSSGMGGLEAAIVNFFSPGEKIIAFTCGDFGNRWAEVARVYGANVVQVVTPVGKAVDPQFVAKILTKETNVKGVLVTLNETATGVLNPIAEIAQVLQKSQPKADQPLLLVDAISGLGAVDLPMDKVGVDVLVTASQKAWMAPPGLSMVAVSPKAYEFAQKAKMPRAYFDFSKFKKFSEKNQTPATPAVTTLFGLDQGLQLMRKEGRQKIFARHVKLMKYTREKIKKLGLELFVADKDASPTLTSVKIPPGVDGKAWLTLLKKEYQTVLAGGMGETKGKIIRIAHMGYVSKRDIDSAVNALKLSLRIIKQY